MGDYKTMEPKVINSVEDLYTLNGHQPFTYKCSRCGKTALVKHFDRRDMNHYIKLLCKECLLSQPRKSLPKLIEDDVLVTDPDQFESFRKGQRFHYNCKECGELVSYTDFRPSRILNYRKMLCKACSQFKLIHSDSDKLRKIPKVIYINDPSELNRLSEGQLYSYNCKGCGVLITKIFKSKKDNTESKLHCISCKRFKFPELFNKELRLNPDKKPKKERIVTIKPKKEFYIKEKKQPKKRIVIDSELDEAQREFDKSFMWYNNLTNCRNQNYPDDNFSYSFCSTIGANPMNENFLKTLKDDNNTYVFPSGTGVSSFDIK